MFFKFILGLLLAIAVGVLGGSTLGEGFFDFKTTASATKVVEDVRDIAVAMQTFKAADDQVRSAYQIADAANSGSVGDATSAQVIALIGSDGEGYLEAGADRTTVGTVNFSLVDGAVYAVVNNGTGLSADLCNELNDLFGNDTTDFINGDGDRVIPAATINTAGFATDEPLGNVAEGRVTEGACVAVGTANTLVYYVQQQ